MNAETRWTPGLQAQVKELALGGHSYSEIGGLLGTSRNAIGGCISRMRDKGEFPLFSPPKPKTSRGPKPKLLYRTPPKPKTATIAPWSRLAPRKAALPPTEPLGRSRPISGLPGKLLVDLEPGTCKWATGFNAAGQHLFCGAQTDGRSSYCPEHAARVYQPRVKP